MFDFSEELTIDSYRIPWLIWIQLLVFFLLIFLLYCFAIFVDLSGDDAGAGSLCSASSMGKNDSLAQKRRFKHSATVAHCLQVGGSESIKGEIARSTSRRIARREDSIEREGSSSKDVTHNYIFHPCNYFRLAQLAFLKCFGLDNTTPENSNSEQKKDK